MRYAPLRALIWWIWDAYEPPLVHTFDVGAAWEDNEPDVNWLGECAWTARQDTTGLGLVAC